MPAAVETYENMSAFASLREPAWHGLGTVFDKPVSTDKMLELAHLKDWNLRFVDAEDVMPDYSFNKRTLHVVRDNPFKPGHKDVLGTVGSRYNIFSNESIFDFGDTLTTGRRRWETAGSLEGGTTVFGTLVATDDIVLDPNGSADTITRYLLLTSSHDGSGNLIAKKTNTRVVCRNTLNVSLRGIGDEFKIRHTMNMEAKVEDAKQALGFADTYDAEFEREAKQMIEKTLTKDKFFAMVKDFYPEPTDNVRGRMTKWETKTQDIMHLWENGTDTVGNLPNSPWKAVQVLTEHNQWFRGIRAGNTENFLAAGAGFDLLTNKFRDDVWQYGLTLAA